jgi:hypothetical protein
MNLVRLTRSALLACLAIVAAPMAMAQDAVPATATATATETAPADAPKLKYSNKWRIEVKEGSNNDGVLRFRVTPEAGTPVDVAVELKKGRSENGVARDVRDGFRAALDKKIFKVEGDDFEDVLVKKRKGPDFSIELVESTVKGTRIDLERE